MTVLTRRAAEIFATATAGGRARGPVVTHARVWGTEIERSFFATGSWTVGLTFETAGDQSIITSTATGSYVKLGRLYLLHFNVTTSTFAHSTASGALQITGLPVSAGSDELRGALAEYRGITKANYGPFSAGAPVGANYFVLSASGSGQSLDETITTADMPSGGTISLRGIIPLLADHA